MPSSAYKLIHSFIENPNSLGSGMRNDENILCSDRHVLHVPSRKSCAYYRITVGPATSLSCRSRTYNGYFRLSWSILLYYLDCVLILRGRARVCVYVCVSAFKLVGFVSFISFYSFHIILCAYYRLSGSSTKAAFVASVSHRVLGCFRVYWCVYTFIPFVLVTASAAAAAIAAVSIKAIVCTAFRCKLRIATAKHFTLVVVVIFYSLCRSKKKLNHFHRDRDTHFSLASCHPLLLLFRWMLLRCSDIPQIELSSSFSCSGSKGQTKEITVEKWQVNAKMVSFDSSTLCRVSRCAYADFLVFSKFPTNKARNKPMRNHCVRFESVRIACKCKYADRYYCSYVSGIFFFRK